MSAIDFRPYRRSKCRVGNKAGQPCSRAAGVYRRRHSSCAVMRSEGRARTALWCFCPTPQRLSRGRRLTASTEGCSVWSQSQLMSEWNAGSRSNGVQVSPGFPGACRTTAAVDRTGIAAAAQSRGRRLTASGCSGSEVPTHLKQSLRLNTFEWNTSSRSNGVQVSPVFPG